jgi:hypothetical protein
MYRYNKFSDKLTMFLKLNELRNKDLTTSKKYKGPLSGCMPVASLHSKCF